ncbi:hypothetical protein FHETE_5564 [Fusarium heterosporum]|uniref:Uncharacterized protein n=1 Tax=Fusarium heterosporum TaxID=42747 RepID=A0A8H5T8V4_FUSHE|nr:hypothetical protein FHETE_5564 [Fusarium heterosporum]
MIQNVKEPPAGETGRKRGFEWDDLVENKRVCNEAAPQHDSHEAHRLELAADTCFGAVLVRTASDDPLPELNGSLLEVRVTGNMVKFYNDDGKLTDLLVSDGLASLSTHFLVRMTASFVSDPSEDKDGSEAKGSIAKGSKAKKRTGFDNGRPARIVVYGMSKDAVAVGAHLSEAQLYLQHPSPDEYDHSSQYHNPHLLLRPGASMPRIQDLKLQREEEKPIQSSVTVLDEVSKGRIWRILDSATGGDVSSQVACSTRLRSTLREHQLVALEMMIEKECGLTENLKFPTLWEPIANDQRQRNKITGRVKLRPESLPGGILADEMGLGKTLTTIALICWYLDVRDTGKITVLRPGSATLVIVPKSIILGWEAQIDKHTFDGMIKYITYHGSARDDQIAKLSEYDVILTTYETLRQDFASKDRRQTLYSHKWHRIILDEAHRIRSRSSQIYEASIAISKLSQVRWCLTGTPIHNSLDNYGALLSFLQVPNFDEKKAFDRFITVPFTKNQSHALDRLQDLVRATSLRRTMIHNGESLGLQPVVENISWVDMDSENAEMYRFFQEKSFQIAKRKHIAKKSKNKLLTMTGDTNILSLILFLRLICNYGRILLPESAIRAWNARDMKAIVSNDWATMEALRRGFITARIDGQASLEQRRQALKRFQGDPNCTVMLATIGSAGEGIDLLSACNVHILEPQWNPMNEAQAIGRVHRFGQTQQVTVTRYIVKKSIEIYIQYVQMEKLRLISQSINEERISQVEVDDERWKKLQETLTTGMHPHDLSSL